MEKKADPEVKGICKILDEFKINNNGRLLDFSCGIGRHSIRLARIGYEVVGYDPSPLFIEIASQRIKLENKNVRISFYKGDPCSVSKLLSSSNQVGFRAIIIMYNSIGYSTLKEDLQIFKNLLSLSSSERTILITQTENRDWRIKNLQPFMITEYERTEIHEQWKFNLEDSLFNGILKFYKKGNRRLNLIRDLPVHLRLYSLHELKQILNETGWKYIKSYGDITTLDPAGLESPEIITVSTNKS
jgi:SAM-dependent methyltransferase